MFGEYGEKSTQTERFVGTFFRRLFGDVEVSGLSTLPGGLIMVFRFGVQEIWSLVRHSVHQLHELSFLIK